MTRQNRGRRSRAEMARCEQELAAIAAEPRRLHPKLVPVLDAYQASSFPIEMRADIRAFANQVFTLSGLTGAESCRKTLTHLGGLVAYGLQHGRTLQIADLLTTALIDEYISRGMPESTDALRAQRRGRLLNLARMVNPGPTTPTRMAPIGHLAIKPCYTPPELAMIIRACNEQPTPARTRDMSTLVGLGAGAGGDSIDVRHMSVEHVVDLGPDGIDVHFQQPRPRIVPVRRALVSTLRTGIANREPKSLLLGDKIDRTNTASRVLQDFDIYRGPAVEMSRLRATWLADLMTDVVPIAVILRAAGLLSARTLSDLLPHLDPWLELKGLTIERADTSGGAS